MARQVQINLRFFRRIRHAKIRTASFPIDLFAEVSPAVLIFDRLKEFVYDRRRHHRRIAAGLKTWKELVVFEDCL